MLSDTLMLGLLCFMLFYFSHLLSAYVLVFIPPTVFLLFVSTDPVLSFGKHIEYKI